MPWHSVVISAFDPIARDGAGTALIEKFGAVYRKAGVPSDVEVFHSIYDDHHVFYFSPTAAHIAQDLLSEFSSVPCPDKPKLSDFRKVPL
jgi:hypothetical protein